MSEPNTPDEMPPLLEVRHQHQPRAFFVYADPGSMKSTFASTFPKPALVLAFDPYSKLEPYRRRGKPGKTLYDGDTPVEFVMSTVVERAAIIQIEQYYDENYHDLNRNFAWERFQSRIPSIHSEVKKGQWATVVLDSLSTLELCIRKFEEYKNNPQSKLGNKQDARQWYGSSGAAIQEVCYNLGWLPYVNVVVLAHVRMTPDRIRDTIYWSPEMPGTYTRKVPGLFPEIYYIHFNPNAEPGKQHYLQTHNDGVYIASTQIPVPNGILPRYSALWNHETESLKNE